MKKFQILHFIFYFLLILTISNCSDSTEVSKGSLSGIIHLENQTDHSNIIIALYDLAVLDPDIVSINQEYPHIGVIINQHTEFDHRLQDPVKYIETDAEGYFEIKKIPTGMYNIVALKDSFGFKYIYEFEIEKDDNEMTQQITLYPETTFSGYFQETSTTFYTDHHYIIEDDTALLPNQSLTIEPGAVIRINPGVDLTIHGTLTTQGEEINMFWITSNDGFQQEESIKYKGKSIKAKVTALDNLNPYPLSLIPDRSEELLQYNSMELSSIASVSDDLIEWGKFDYGNISFSTAVSNLDITHIIYRHSESGLTIIDTDNVNASNIISKNCLNPSNGGIVALNNENIFIEKNIIVSNYNGLYVKFCDSTLIKNNYMSNNYRSIWGLTVFGDIEHNELTSNSECDIKLTGNTTQSEIRIKYNNLRSDTGIWQYEQGSFNQFYILTINNNNFYCNDWFIIYDSSGHYHGVDINANHNYFFDCNNILCILEKIVDTNTTHPILVEIIIDDFVNIPYDYAGIQ